MTSSGCATIADARHTLRERFGFEDFLPGQQAVIGHLLAGRSAAAVFPTGGGKSLCYQIPALHLAGVTLVVSPLIALMKDQIDALAARGIPAARLDSTLDKEAYRDVMHELREGSLALLYVAPERFDNERFNGAIEGVRIALFAVDEAHCISEWGHNFRPDYLKLAAHARRVRAERVLALTATATERVLDDVRRAFAIEPECAIRTGFHRPNLRLATTPVAGGERDGLLFERLQGRPPGPTIVYVTLQKTAEQIADRLSAAGLESRAYHAGMDGDARAAIQEWFMASDRAIVVATIAFGMGVDKSDIRYVYHYNLPKSLEGWSQEIGRAGRDGQPALCEVLACADDLTVLENFAFGDTPAAGSVRGLLEAIFGESERFSVSLSRLAADHDIRILVVRTLLTYLELDGLLERGTPVYATYRLRPHASSKEILAQLDGERRQLVRQIFACITKQRTWFTLDIEQAVKRSGVDRLGVVQEVDRLAEQGHLELRPANVQHRYRRLETPASLEELADDLHRRLQRREASEIARLRQVVDLIGHDGCQWSMLGAHFGDPLDEACGRCTHCETGSATRLPPRISPSIGADLWREAEAFRSEQPVLRSDPRAFARYLCGLSSPRLARARLKRTKLWGALAAHPFSRVLARCTPDAAAKSAIPGA